MTLELLPHDFSVCQLNDWRDADLSAPFVFLSRTDEENSLVCPSEAMPPNALLREDGWRGMRIAGELDFSLIGILSGISALLAAQKISIFALSTYKTDYILVRRESLPAALNALRGAGYAIAILP